MKQWNWLTDCNKYEWQTIDWLNMLLSREATDVIVESRELIHTCLMCTYFTKCWDRIKLVNYLDSNLIKKTKE